MPCRQNGLFHAAVFVQGKEMGKRLKATLTLVRLFFYGLLNKNELISTARSGLKRQAVLNRVRQFSR